MAPWRSSRVITSEEFWTRERKRASDDFRLSVERFKSSARTTRSRASAELLPRRETASSSPLERERVLAIESMPLARPEITSGLAATQPVKAPAG